jgi:hypothetical protein
MLRDLLTILYSRYNVRLGCQNWQTLGHTASVIGHAKMRGISYYRQHSLPLATTLTRERTTTIADRTTEKGVQNTRKMLNLYKWINSFYTSLTLQISKAKMIHSLLISAAEWWPSCTGSLCLSFSSALARLFRYRRYCDCASDGSSHCN